MYLILQQLTAEMISPPFVTSEVDVMIKIWILTLTRVRPSSYIDSAELFPPQILKKLVSHSLRAKVLFYWKQKEVAEVVICHKGSDEWHLASSQEHFDPLGWWYFTETELI